MDVAEWRRILGTIKAHGLNHVRFHSWCPPEAAFEAGDELGVYFQVEAATWPNAVAVLAFIVFPILWMVVTSFKPPQDVMVSPPRFLFTPTLDNYVHAIWEKNFLFYIKNTLFISVTSTVLVVVAGALAAYSFARYNVGDGHILFFILSTKMFPAIAVILPYFLIFRDTGKTAVGRFLGVGLDQPGALIISYTMFNLPFAIWLMVRCSIGRGSAQVPTATLRR